MNIKKILLLIIPIFILFGFGIIETKKVFSQPACEVVDLSFNPNGDQGDGNFLPANIQIIVETNGECSGSSIKINVRETSVLKKVHFETILNGFSETNKFATILTPAGNAPYGGGMKCFGTDCDLWLSSEVESTEITTKDQPSSGKGRLVYRGDNVQGGNPPGFIIWPEKETSVTYSTDGKTEAPKILGSCFAKINALYLTDQESGDSKTFNKAGDPTLTAEGETDGCSPDNGTMKIAILEGNTDPYASMWVSGTNLGVILNSAGYFQKYDDINNTMMTIRNVQGGFMRFKIVWKLGEKDCDGVDISLDTFCGLRAVIYLPDQDKIISTDEFKYDAPGDAKFSILSSEVFDKSGAPISVLGSGFRNSNVGLKTSPCYVEDPNGDGKTDDAGLKDGCLGLLAPLPDFDRFEAGANPFTNWINTILRVIIGISTLLAVVMLVIMGAQYMSSSLVTSKANAKSRIADIFIGLGLLLGIFIILNLINPNLLNLDPNVPVAELVVQETDDSGAKFTINRNESISCGKEAQKCRNITVPIISTGKQATISLADKLDSLNSKISGWRVTEAWQPSRSHKSKCHPEGWCVDAGFSSGTNPPEQDIVTFIKEAEILKLCAIWEEDSQTDYEKYKNALTSAGLNGTKYVKNLGTWISAPHFSIYDGVCK